MGCELVFAIPGLSDLADLEYINLNKQIWKQPNSTQCGTLQFGKQPPLPVWNGKMLRVKCYFRNEWIT